MDKKKWKLEKRPKPEWSIGKLLMKLPSSRLFYPRYLAEQLDTVCSDYESPLLPPVFDGLRIAFLSDIHFGPYFTERRVRDLAERVNALNADVVLLGGDYGSNSDSSIDFFKLHPGFRAKTAVLATFGNHDRRGPESDVPLIQAAMRADGIIPLLNEVYILERERKKLAFATTDDYFAGMPALKRVAKQCKTADFTVFFPHNPDILPETYGLRGGPFYQLALCGHTHGGQIAIRGITVRYSSKYKRRFLSGWYHEEGVDIMVSNGVGVTAIPLRLGAVPQIHLITLKTKRET